MLRAARRPSFREALRWGRRGVPRRSPRVLRSAGSRPAVGDEGGFAPNLDSNEEALQVHRRRRSRPRATSPASRSRSRSTRRRASSTSGTGRLRARGRGRAQARRPRQMVEYYAGLVRRAIRSSSIEDGMAEDDWAGLVALLTKQLGGRDPARRRRPVRDQRRAPRARHPARASPTRS